MLYLVCEYATNGELYGKNTFKKKLKKKKKKFNFFF